VSAFGCLSAGICVLLAALCQACLPSDPHPKGFLAVKRSPDGTLIRVITCEMPAHVKSLRLETTDDDEIIWQLTASGDSDVTAFVVGVPPEGFTEVVDLGDSSASNRVAVVNVDEVAGLLVFEFDPDELRDDRWLVQRRGELTDAALDQVDPC
jgi:hypothetical protein